MRKSPVSTMNTNENRRTSLMSFVLPMLFFMLVGIHVAFAQEETPKQEIRIDAYRPSIVVFISAEEAYEAKPYGWWTVWQRKKRDPELHCKTPCVKTDLPAGIYTVIVYLMFSQEETSLKPQDPRHPTSDGVIIPNYYIDENTRRSFVMKKSDFREWNCLSCPWLYLYEQGRFVRKIEVLKDAVGVDGARTTTFVVDPKAIDDSRIRLQIREEKDETTQLDAVLLTIDGVLCPSCLSSPPSPLGAVDGKYLTLIKGELVELEFTLPEALAVGARIAVETHGYYEPEQCFLERFIVEHSLRSEALSR